MQQLVELFSKPPASFAWSTNDKGRTIGASKGFVLDIWPDHVEVVAIFPLDNTVLAARNGTLIQLLLTAMRPDWSNSGDWLAMQMRRSAATDKPFEEVNVIRRVRFKWDRLHSRATVQVRL